MTAYWIQDFVFSKHQNSGVFIYAKNHRKKWFTFFTVTLFGKENDNMAPFSYSQLIRMTVSERTQLCFWQCRPLTPYTFTAYFKFSRQPRQYSNYNNISGTIFCQTWVLNFCNGYLLSLRTQYSFPRIWLCKSICLLFSSKAYYLPWSSDECYAKH